MTKPNKVTDEELGELLEATRFCSLDGFKIDIINRLLDEHAAMKERIAEYEELERLSKMDPTQPKEEGP